MKKPRTLAVAAFCGALVLFGMQSQAAAQQVEKPGNLGENKGTGEVIKRMGSWDLVKIEETATSHGHSINPWQFPRQKQELPVDMRERKGISWEFQNRRITAEHVFKNLKETVIGSNFGGGGSDLSLQVLVKAAVTGDRVNSENPKNDFVAMNCTLDFTSPSGDRHRPSKDYSGRQYRIYPGSYYPAKADRFWFSRKGEIQCGAADTQWGWVKPEEDFTINYRLLVNDGFGPGYDLDVTFHFYYKWRGWREPSKPATSGSTNSPGDSGWGPLDREWQYRWAQKQDASTLESRLISNAARLFNSPSVASEKLSTAFADISVIIADRVAKANFSSDDKDAASPNWSTHKNWAARQGPKGALDNLQQKLSAAFNYLSRSQQDSFFADVSVAMAKAEIAGPTDQAAQDGPFVKPKKDVFAVGEKIDVDYGYVKSTGQDFVVIMNPSRLREAKGRYSGITEDYSKGLELSTTAVKDRRGTFTFEGLPAGEYRAAYYSWGEGQKFLAEVPFTVGNAPPPPPGNGNPAPSFSGDLTGLWRNPGGAGIYRVRQIGSKLVWGLDAIAMGSFANMFQGQITDDKIDGVWEDLPGSPTIGGGRMLLRIESECRFVRVSSVNRYGADVWVRIGSKCDSAGLTQRSNPDGAKPASTATKPATGATDKEAANAKPKPGSPVQTKPKIEEIADNRGRTNPPTASTNKTNKPAPTVEDIPDDTSTKVATNKPTTDPTRKPPVVEEIPDDTSTKVATNKPTTDSRRKPPVVEEIPETDTGNKSGSNRGADNPPPTTRSGENKLPPNVVRTNDGKLLPKDGYEWANPDDPKDFSVKKKEKVRDPNKPDIWTRLGGAAREAITAQQNPGQTQPTQQPDGQCRGGSYWLGTPTPDSWVLNTGGAGVRIPWSTPLGVTGAKIFVFDAGTNNMRVDSALPENANACGLSYSFYMNSAGYFDAYLYQGTTPVAGPVRFVVTQ